MEGSGRSTVEELVTISVDMLFDKNDETQSAVQTVIEENVTENCQPNEDEGKTEKLHQCHFCKEKFTRMSSLKRHIERKHKDSSLTDSFDKGRTICLECGKHFQRVKELTTHLIKAHDMEFHIEKLFFENLTGLNFAFHDWLKKYKSFASLVFLN